MKMIHSQTNKGNIKLNRLNRVFTGKIFRIFKMLVFTVYL